MPALFYRVQALAMNVHQPRCELPVAAQCADADPRGIHSRWSATWEGLSSSGLVSHSSLLKSCNPIDLRPAWNPSELDSALASSLPWPGQRVLVPGCHPVDRCSVQRQESERHDRRAAWGLIYSESRAVNLIPILNFLCIASIRLRILPSCVFRCFSCRLWCLA